MTGQLSVRPGKDVIILSLTDGSLMSALHVGARLHGWVYPFLSVDIIDASRYERRLGVIAQNGTFYSTDYKADSEEVITALHQQKTPALQSLNTKVQSLGVSFDLHLVRGRDIVLVADGLTDTTTILAACQFVHDLRAKAIYTLIGNASKTVAEICRTYSDASVVLDVVNVVDFNPFKQYQFTTETTKQDQLEFMKNIKTYWI